MAIDIDALKSEIDLDPTGIGYPIDILGIHAAINLPRSTIPFDRQLVPSHEVLDATVAGEYGGLSATERERYALFISAGEINVESANTRAAFLAMFTAGTTTRANLGALQTRDGSRAEELFGEGISIEVHRVAEALRLP